MRKLLEYILNEDETENFDFQPFIKFVLDHLDLDEEPDITLVDKIEDRNTFGLHNHSTHEITVATGGRHQIDVMRTIAHEIVHFKQSLSYTPDGTTGSKDENEANARAGIILRDYAEKAFTQDS